jgi:K+-transporting ATPase ATPase C chain
MREQLRPALAMLAAFTVLTGLVYPLAITGIARVVWPGKSAGSILLRDGRPVGSALIGQPFEAPGYFWSRPSATSPVPYDAAASAGSNLAPTNPLLVDSVKARVAALHAADPGNDAPVPVDLVTSSASGLDPDISPAAALYQVGRVARARGLPAPTVRRLVEAHVEPRQLGFLGEPRVNVLELNLALDSLAAAGRGRPVAPWHRPAGSRTLNAGGAPTALLPRQS